MTQDFVEAIRIAGEYHEELEQCTFTCSNSTRIPVKYRGWRWNVFLKSACRDIKRELEEADYPFHVSALDILQAYVDKMNAFAAETSDKRGSICFLAAVEVGEYVIEELIRWRENSND